MAAPRGTRPAWPRHHADNPDKKLTYRSITNSTYATLTLTAESSRVKQIYDRARATNKDCPANGLIRLALAANDGTLPAAATPCLLVPLDMSFSGFTEKERGKFRFSLTNGATISGEEIVHPYAPQNFGETVRRGWRRCLIWLLMSHSLDFCTASVGCLWLFCRCVLLARGKQGSSVLVYSFNKDRILPLVHVDREVVEPEGSAPDALTPRAYHQCSTSPQSKNNSN